MEGWKVLAGIVGVIVLVFAGVVVWSVFVSEGPDTRYNGFSFEEVPGDPPLWETSVSFDNEVHTILFYHHPSEVERVTSDRTIARSIANAQTPPEQVYVSLHPDAGSRAVVAAVEFSRILGERYDMLNYDVQSALSEPEEGVDALVRSCDDARDGVLVIEMRETTRNLIRSEGNCVILEYASAAESSLVADRFAYELVGIM